MYETGTLETPWLQERLRLSRRTIQRDIHTLQDYLEVYGVTLDLSSSGSLRLLGQPASIADVVAIADGLPTVLALNVRDREFYIVSELLWADGPVKMTYLSHRLKVAEASISGDLDRLSDWFRQRSLLLVRRRGYGVEVLGSEKAKREALVELIHHHLPIYQVMNAWSSEKQHVGNEAHLHSIRTWFSESHVNQVKNVLDEVLYQVNPPLEEGAFYSFMLHVLLSVERMRRQQEIPEQNDTPLSETNSVEFQAAKEILAKLIPDDPNSHRDGEIQYLASHLLGAKVQLTDLSSVLPIRITVAELAYRITVLVSYQIEFALHGDEHLIRSLTQHLVPALHRMSTGMLIRNPLLSDVKRTYPELFGVVKDVCHTVFGEYEYQVPDEEIGYLTMHYGAAIERLRARRRLRITIVCPNGMSSAELLAERIRTEFPQLEIVSISPIDALKQEVYDVVISTVPLPKYERVITVSPFLTATDIERIKNQLDVWRPVALASSRMTQVSSFERKIKEVDPNLSAEAETLIHYFHVRQVVAKDVKELIGLIAEDTVLLGISQQPKEVQAAITAREQLGSVVVPAQSVALLHATTSGVSQCYVSVYRLADGFDMASIGLNREMVTTILVILAPPNQSAEVMSMLGTLSSSLITRDGFLEMLKHADESLLRETIQQIFQQAEER